MDMSLEDLSKYIIAIMLLALSCQNGTAQSSPMHTDRMESLIDEWNFANNTQNLHSFESVYADRLILEGENVSKRTAIARKQQLFSGKPSFRQRITTEIHYTPDGNGVTRCEFTTERLENSTWKKYASHLLVSHAHNRYSIVGEGSVPLKKTLRKKQQTDAPVVAEQDSQR